MQPPPCTNGNFKHWGRACIHPRNVSLIACLGRPAGRLPLTSSPCRKSLGGPPVIHSEDVYPTRSANARGESTYSGFKVARELRYFGVLTGVESLRFTAIKESTEDRGLACLLRSVIFFGRSTLCQPCILSLPVSLVFSIVLEKRDKENILLGENCV